MVSSTKFSLALFLLSSSVFLIQGSLGEILCEELGKDVCAFAIASSGKRCILEKYAGEDGKAAEFQCRTSEVVVERMAGYIETDKCVSACGVDRNAVGISSDALLEPQFTNKLCSPPCFEHCPNIVDLYFNLAAGEGVFLPDICEDQRSNPHRSMIELMSSGAAPGPASPDHFASSAAVSAPAPAPM
ncbi:uncharacterized protein LOC131168585 isoform X2 [Malania oleifera]|uniref:uncharacterized protein LOC131168585 isoform X2 n=1 Tax=Malania oleifera TaxID=397392 RepID=UPI0025AEB1DE|nr:uncharacterized protein LOC131168585 isoform X2 [Malania oleifera]